MTSGASSRILVLTPRFPFPIVAGDTLRIVNMCKALSEQYTLTLASLGNRKEAEVPNIDQNVFDEIHYVYHPAWRGGLNVIKALPSSQPLQIAYYNSQPFRNLVRNLIPEHDLVLAHLLRAGQFVEDVDRPSVLEMTDALSLNYDRVSRLNTWGIKPLLYRIERGRIAPYERAAIEKFDLISLVSEVDRDYLLQGNEVVDANKVEVYTNGINLDERPYRAPDSTPSIVFIGNMRTVHNQESCRSFATEVLPLIREQIPEARFRIVGHATEKTMRSFETLTGVDVTGWVDSIPEASREAMAGMGVMQVGAGVQNKVLEYMALGLPVIANQTGMEGINAQEGKHFLRAETPRQVADRFVKLYRDEPLRNALSRKARTFVENNHKWDVVLAKFVVDIERIIRVNPPFNASKTSVQ